jgi:hypothetical protein
MSKGPHINNNRSRTISIPALKNLVENPPPNAPKIDYNHPWTMTLACAVPLWAQQMEHLSLTEIMDGKRCEELNNIMMEVGEGLIYRVSKPGESARGFNALAEGIARLAYSPGGVTCFGMHFEYTPGKWIEGKHGVRV